MPPQPFPQPPGHHPPGPQPQNAWVGPAAAAKDVAIRALAANLRNFFIATPMRPVDRRCVYVVTMYRGSGVRKLRWRASGKGKRGGTRVIYCCQEESELWLLTLYAKGERESIPAHELKQIRETISGQANDQGR